MGLGNETRYFAARDDRTCGTQTLLQGVLIAFRWPMMMGFALLGAGARVAPGGRGRGRCGCGVCGAGDPSRARRAPASRRARHRAGGLVGRDDVDVGLHAQQRGRDLRARPVPAVASAPSRAARTDGGLLRPAGAGRAQLLGGLGAPDLNRFWSWLAMGLTAGNCGPMFLRLYWWRCNAAGAAAGILCGMAGTLAQRVLCPAWGEAPQFAVALVCSGAGTVIGSLATAPVAEGVTERFVRVTRPFGLWGKYAPAERRRPPRTPPRPRRRAPSCCWRRSASFRHAVRALCDAAGACISGALGLCASVAVWRLWGRWL